MTRSRPSGAHRSEGRRIESGKPDGRMGLSKRLDHRLAHGLSALAHRPRHDGPRQGGMPVFIVGDLGTTS